MADPIMNPQTQTGAIVPQAPSSIPQKPPTLPNNRQELSDLLDYMRSKGATDDELGKAVKEVKALRPNVDFSKTGITVGVGEKPLTKEDMMKKSGLFGTSFGAPKELPAFLQGKTPEELAQVGKLPIQRVAEKTVSGFQEAGSKLAQAGERMTKVFEGRGEEGVPAIADAITGIASALFAVPSAIITEVPVAKEVVEGSIGLLQSPFKMFEDKIVEDLKAKGYTEDSEEMQKVRSVFGGIKTLAPIAAAPAIAKVAKPIAAKIPKAKEIISEKAPAVLEKAETTLKAAEAAQKQKFAERLVTEKVTKKGVQEAIQKGKEIEGVFEAKPKLTVTEKTLAKRVSELVPDLKEGFFKGENLRKNYKAIQNKKTSIAENVGKKLEEIKKPVDKGTIESTLDSVRSQAEKSGELSTISGNSLKEFGKMKDQFIREFDKVENTTKGLWEARKAYDQWVLKQKPTTFEGNVTAFKNANNVMRRTINETIQQFVPEAKFGEFLKDYSSLQSAIENVSTKVDTSNMAKLGGIKKAVQNLSNAKLNLGTAGLAGLGFATGTLPAAAAIMASVGGLYTLFRAGVKAGRGLRSSAITVLNHLKKQTQKLQTTERIQALNAIKEIEAIVPKLKEPEQLLLLGSGT